MTTISCIDTATLTSTFVTMASFDPPAEPMGTIRLQGKDRSIELCVQDDISPLEAVSLVVVLMQANGGLWCDWPAYIDSQGLSRHFKDV
ncbi:hypothetical protein [Thaumasiovibrio sp. DFM-14]|uniref:hypothetical protein n=1 Tax=Thaumasiovibrio sp. DFM-14 TaxID=3384792 RepID=UPI0039A2A0A8